jgi:four helix bundle protein
VQPYQFPQTLPKASRSEVSPTRIRFYNIAQGSLEECRYYLILARDLRYGDSSLLVIALEEISKMLNSYSRSIRAATFG